MKRPGDRLRALAARVCAERTMARLVDPAVADLQHEDAHAARQGRPWKRRWIRFAGHAALVKALALHGAARTAAILRDASDEDRRTLARTFAVGGAVMLAATLLLTWIPFRTVSVLNRPHADRLALHLVPQAVPISICFGLTFGILWGLGRGTASRRTRAVVLAAAAAASVVSFAMLAWVVPESNQAFRVLAAGRPIVKGLNELTLAELSRLLEPGGHEPMLLVAAPTRSQFALAYHGRWALGAAPLVLSVFALAVIGQRRRRRLLLVLAGCAATLGYYAALVVARNLGLDRTLPAIAAAWMPNAVLLAVSAALVAWRLATRAHVERVCVRDGRG